jgi:hypothetical protein
MPRVALAFPTGTDPRSPYLALPYLAASLRRAGVDVSMHDLDIGGLRALLRPEHLATCARALQDRVRGVAMRSPFTRRLLGLSERLPSTIDAQLSVFDDPARFFDPHALSASREAVLDGLDICAAGVDPRVHYSISPVRYDVDGVDTTSLASLIEATADDRYNVFAEYWETAFFPSLAKDPPLLLGITLTNRQQLLPGLLLARRARARGLRVVLGGALLAKFVDRLASLPEFFRHFADAVVAYEGDTAIVELAGALAEDRQWSNVPNLMYLEGTRLRVNRTHVEDVDRLPTPDFEGLPLDQYLSPYRVFPVLMGKGCYFNRCKFCDIPFINHISRKAYRLRSAEKIAADVATLHDRFDCRHFEFTDEALPPTELEQLGEALAPYQSRRFRFVGYARLEPAFTRGVCRRLASMGVRKLFFGLESASQHTLTHMDKGIRIADVPSVLEHCREAGICFHLFSIIGFPEETEERARETLQFFEDHADLLNAPGNSFDVHEFGLELRTAYAHLADVVGVEIGATVRSADFAIGAGRDWVNARGLTHEQVDALLAEASTLLRRVFRQWHASPQPLWPPYEEYALQYADHYEGRSFPFRTALPPEADIDRYRVDWRPGCVAEAREDATFVISRDGEAGMDEESFNHLSRMGTITAGALLDSLAAPAPPDDRDSARAALRDVIDDWIERGLVQLLPIGDGAVCD